MVGLADRGRRHSALRVCGLLAMRLKIATHCNDLPTRVHREVVGGARKLAGYADELLDLCARIGPLDD